MMKNRILNISSIVLLTATALTILVSCGEDRWAEYKPYTALAEWTDSLMHKVYYWSDELPKVKPGEYFATPATFLNNIKYSSDNLSSVDTIVNTTNSYGITAESVVSTTNDTIYYALVTYVYSDSPAAKAGLKRGDWIYSVNGEPITKTYKSTILASGKAKTLELGTYSQTSSTEYSVTSNGTKLSLPASTTISDDPVRTYKIITIGKKTVGYLLYGSFTAGANDIYNNELRKAFATFSAAGVNEVVIDLRYNKGGDNISSTQLLASMLVPSSQLGNTFAYLRHNSSLNVISDTLTLNKTIIGTGANLNLSKVYVITTNKTAQLSELLITTLVPYMTVTTVGATTAGTLGVTTAYQNSSFPYIFHIVTNMATNAKDATYTTSGITASTSASDISNYSGVLDFGDVNENMFSVVATLIGAE